MREVRFNQTSLPLRLQRCDSIQPKADKLDVTNGFDTMADFLRSIQQ